MKKEKIQIAVNAEWPLPHLTRTRGHSELPIMVTPSLHLAICFPFSLENLTFEPARFTISVTRLQKTSYDIMKTILSAIFRFLSDNRRRRGRREKPAVSPMLRLISAA